MSKKSKASSIVIQNHSFYIKLLLIPVLYYNQN
nr:MAG TPA: hypothetical protein [Caudoviricetes sp.]